LILCKFLLSRKDKFTLKPDHGKSNCYWLWKIKERSELSGKMKSLKFLGMPFYNKENNEMKNKFEEAFKKQLLS